MLPIQELKRVRERALKMLKKAQIAVTGRDVDKIEIVDFDLGNFEKIGLQQLTYVDTDYYSAGEIILFPGQTVPEHRHPGLGRNPGKQQTLRCRYGTLYLYVPGEPSPGLRAELPEDRKSSFTVFHEVILQPGEQYTLAPNTLHWMQAGPEGAVVSEFCSGRRNTPDVFTDPEINRVPQVVSQGLKIVLLGAPGAGKGTQARLMSTKYGTAHLSMGNLLREEIARGSDIGTQVAPMLKKGEMAPNSVVYRILDPKLARLNSYILDGFPRNIEQAEHLERVLNDLNTKIDCVFLLDLPVEVVVERLSGRRVCEKCSRTYHIRFYQSDRCNCGGKLIQRPDDNPDAIRRRMEVYNEKIVPVRKFYESRGVLYPIAADKEMETTFGEISHILDDIILPAKNRERAGEELPE